jgi:hypothetical protein
MSDKPANVYEHPKLDFLPESVIALQREMQMYHKILFQKYPHLASLWGTVDMLALMAAEVNIVVDGMFDAEGVDALANLIRQRLVARRTEVARDIILPPGVQKH